MVLEKLVSIRDAIRNPLWMFIIGGIVSVISLFISFVFFPETVGIFFSFVVTFTMTPFMINLFSYEEAKEEELCKKKDMNFFGRYREILNIYTAFFLGVILVLTIIYLIIPEEYVQKVFEDQLTQIKLIRGSVAFVDTFQKIIINNIGVLFISFLFAFLFGSGALFILSWNASVLATAIGLTAKSLGGFKGLPVALLIYFPHGSLEILAYFIVGIAGGIISATISKRRSKYFYMVLRDTLMLIGISIVILFLAGFIESTAMALST